MMSGFVDNEKNKWVAFEAIKCNVEIFVEGEGMKKVELSWSDLTELEQKLIRLIAEGKYGDAYDLSFKGASKEYRRNLIKVFLETAAKKIDSSIQSVFYNDHVKIILNSV